MLTSMEIVKNIAGNSLISRAIEDATQEVSKGQGLGVSLGRAEVFPDLAIQMIQVGEQSGELEQMLEKMSVVYENEAEASILGMTSLLEPLMILFMGVIMGFIVLSICLPIFEMNQLVGNKSVCHAVNDAALPLHQEKEAINEGVMSITETEQLWRVHPDRTHGGYRHSGHSGGSDRAQNHGAPGRGQAAQGQNDHREPGNQSSSLQTGQWFLSHNRAGPSGA